MSEVITHRHFFLFSINTLALSTFSISHFLVLIIFHYRNSSYLCWKLAAAAMVARKMLWIFRMRLLWASTTATTRCDSSSFRVLHLRTLNSYSDSCIFPFSSKKIYPHRGHFYRSCTIFVNTSWCGNQFSFRDTKAKIFDLEIVSAFLIRYRRMWSEFTLRA
jgi:hypothetical protein